MSNPKHCACGSSKPYRKCCGKIHRNHELAHTAEQLMRSRFTAFTLADGKFLTQTHHKSTRNPNDEKEIVSWAKSVKWLRLEVLNSTKGAGTDIEGTVEFNAYFYEKGEVHVIHENSFFKKEEEYWFYVGEFYK